MAKKSPVNNVDETVETKESIRQYNATNQLKLKIDNLKTFHPLTENQKTFFDAYRQGEPNIILHGVAGTGKSFCAVYKGIEEVLNKDNGFQQVVIVRSAVQSREIGHLPGSEKDKLEIFQQPYKQIATSLFGRPDAYQRLTEQGHVMFVSTSFVRGMTFDNSIIIVDETQNLTLEECHAIATRIGYRSKIIWCGDYRQNDLYRKKNDVSGILPFFNILSRMPSFCRIEFGIDDIVRSELCKEYIIAKMEYDQETDLN